MAEVRGIACLARDETLIGDGVLFFEDVSKYGDFATDEVIVEPNRLADKLITLEKAIQKMSSVLKKSAQK